MDAGSLSDKSKLYSFIRPDKTTLFDFQLGAVAHCVGRLVANKSAILALDTGLGKTCTLRAIVDDMQVRAIVFVPGGLVQQVSQSLRRQPWESTESCIVIAAETSKQLQAVRPPHKILVVNRSLSVPSDIRNEYDLIVVDEAHQALSLRVVSKFSREPVLFLTACPTESSKLMDWFRPVGTKKTSSKHANGFAEACFIVEKTPRVFELLGLAQPKIIEVPGDPIDIEAYSMRVIHALKYFGTGGHIMRARVALYVAEILPLASRQAAEFVSDRINCVLRQTPSVVFPKCSFLRQCQELCNKHSISWPYGLVLPSQEELPVDANSRCPCCSLTDSECALLYSAHCDALPRSLPLWVGKSIYTRGFTSAIIRFHSKISIEATISKHPVPDNILVFILTTDKSAAYRAKLIKKFASHDGQRAKLNVLSRAFKHKTAPDTLLRVGALGMGRLLLSEVERCLARPRLLLADATVDVGFDLHRHIDGVYMDTILRTPAELRQITGRVSRIAVDRAKQGSVDVLTKIYPGTLDKLFLNHLNNKSRAEEEERKMSSAALEIANRARSILSEDKEAVMLFE